MKQKIFSLFILLFIIGGAIASTPEITQLNYTPSPAVPGSTITVLVQLENPSEYVMEEIEIILEENFPFSATNDTSKYVGNIEKYGKTLVQFEVYVDPKAENQSYPLKFTLKSKTNELGITKPVNIVVDGKQPIIKVIDISNTKLVPGQEQEIIFSLQNIGTSTAYDITAELQEDRTITATGTIVSREITPLGSAIGYVEELNPKEIKTVNINLSVNREASLQNYTLPVVVSYRDGSGTIISKTSFIGFKISGHVILDATLKEKIELIAGQTTEINIELFNKGFGKADFTVINIEADFGNIEKDKQFIGSLQPNDVDSFKTKISVDSDVETQTGILKLLVTYQDTDSKQKTNTLEIPIKIYSAIDGAALNPINPIPLIVFLLILAGIIYLGYNKFYKKEVKK